MLGKVGMRVHRGCLWEHALGKSGSLVLFQPVGAGCCCGPPVPCGEPGFSFSTRLTPFTLAPQEAYNAVVRYFGESPKTTPPSVFFPVFVRFIRSYKVSRREAFKEKRLREN